ncbi:MAG: hypothetical protein ACYC2R_07625 [Burkholderiales bacterium]
MKKLSVFFALLLMAEMSVSVAHSDAYNPANNQLTIDSVQVGNTVYTGVVITVGSVISVGGSSPQAPTTTTPIGNYVCTSVAGQSCSNPYAYLNLLSTGYWATDGGCGGQYQIAGSVVHFLTGGCGAVLWGDAVIGPNTLTFSGNAVYTKQ